MGKPLLFLSIIVLFSYQTHSQSAYSQYKGTFIVEAICRNGIVVTSDSRASFFDTNKKVAVYIDNTPKIFKVKNLVIGIAGNYSLIKSKITVEQILDGFKNSIPLRIPVANFYDLLLTYVKKIVSQIDDDDWKNNTIIVTGYENNKAVIYCYDHGQKPTIKYSGYKTSMPTQDSSRQYIHYLPIIGFDSAIYICKQLVNYVSDYNNQVGERTIGGPISVFAYSKQKVYVNKIQNSNYFRNRHELYQGIKANKIKIWARSPTDSTILMEHLKSDY